MPPVSLNIGAMRNSGGLFNTNSGGSSGVHVNPLPPRAESQNRTSSGFSFNNTGSGAGGLLNYNFGATASAARQQHPPSPGVAAMNVAKRQAERELEGLQG